MKQHEHEWRPVDERIPFIEDGRAIFNVECNYVEILGSTTSERLDETFHKEGASCEETKSYSFDWARVSSYVPDEIEKFSVTRDVVEEYGDEIEVLQDLAYETISQVEIANDPEIVECDPDERNGRVVVRAGDYEVEYRA